MNVIELLSQDHAEVDALFRQVDQASSPEQIEELSKQIVRELSVHAAVEEQFVYPTLRAKVDDGNDLADEAIDEHQDIKRNLADLEKLDAGSPEHRKTLDELIRNVRHHVEEEEGELFTELRAALDESTLEKLGTLCEQAKKVVPTHPHPLVPGTATAQLVAGPWASMVDRVRDLVSK